MILIILCFLAGVFNAVMDVLRNHFSTSIFKNFNPQFWNPLESWINKWKLDSEGKPIVGKERFFGSSRWFAWVGDAWHRAQSLMLACFVFAIAFNPFGWMLTIPAAYLSFQSAFTLFYDYILRKK